MLLLGALHCLSVIAVDLLVLMELCLLLDPLCMEVPRVPSWDLFCWRLYSQLPSEVISDHDCDFYKYVNDMEL